MLRRPFFRSPLASGRLIGSGRPFDSGRRAAAAGGLALVVAGGLAIGPVGLASAKSPTGMVVKVTGAVSGTLRATAANCGGTGAKGGQVEFYQRLKGSKQMNWTLTFLDPHNGKWPGHTSGDKLGTSSFVLESSGNAAWVASSGSFTTKGVTGSANISLVPESYTPDAHGKLHVTATWNCPSSE